MNGGPLSDRAAVDLPLAGVRVTDLSTSYAGPTASMYLADMGADVLKIERPPAGDDTRSWGPPFVGGASVWFQSANRNKRSVTIDLRRDAGRKALERLLGEADVLIESFNPTKLAALGLDPVEVMERHPRLIYCALSGYGFTGPDAGKSGYDLAAQARSGLMSVTGAAGGTPQRVSTALSDVVAGMVAAFAIVATLRRQARSGRGEFIDVSLLDADLALMAPRIASFLAGEPEPGPSGGTDSVLAVYQPFETADRAIVIAIGTDAIWNRFCNAIELPELASDPTLATNADRREARPRILPLIAERLLAQTAEHWLARLDAEGVPASRVQTLSEVVADPQVQARAGIDALDNGVRVVMPPWRLGLDPAPRTHSAPPPPGAHTRSVLEEHHSDELEIREALQESAAR